MTNGKYKNVDTNTYRVWQNTDPAAGQVGKYLVDPSGKPVYFVDPGINGILKKGDDREDPERFHAPKATLMSYIIKGVLGQNLPWGLVILGAMMAVVLEVSGVAALAFAVGIYLPISTSTPIFIGGIVRYLVDLYLKRKLKAQNLTEEQQIAFSRRFGELEIHIVKKYLLPGHPEILLISNVRNGEGEHPRGPKFSGAQQACRNSPHCLHDLS